jgi:hypothetical protein
MKEALAELETMSPGEAMDQRMQGLISDVLDHVRLEEQDELPRLQQELTQEQLAELGRRMAEFKQATA